MKLIIRARKLKDGKYFQRKKREGIYTEAGGKRLR